METSFKTSFIPKKPIAQAPVSTAASHSTSLFTLISVFILILSVVMTGGVYLYKGYLDKEKQSLADSLLKSRDRFDKDTIEELELFDKREKASRQVLDNHIVLTPLFSLLGNLTIPSIQYTKFEHRTTEKGFSVSINGVARDYKSIAIQADTFNSAKGRFFKNVVFSNLNRDKGNNVLFDLNFDVDPGLLSYDNNILLDNESNNTILNTNPAVNSVPNQNVINTNPAETNSIINTNPANTTGVPPVTNPITKPQ